MLPNQHLTKKQKDLIGVLWDLNAIKIAGTCGEPRDGYRTKFHDKHPNSPNSTYYLNLRTNDNPRRGPINEQAMSLISTALLDTAASHGLNPKWVAGIPNAGVPLAQVFWEEQGAMQLQLEKFEEGGVRRISGVKNPPENLVPGTTCLLVDDVLSEADTKLEAVAAVRKVHNLDACGILVVVDRLQGGRERLKREGIQVFAALTMADIFQHLCHASLITFEQMNLALSYPALLAGYKARIGIE